MITASILPFPGLTAVQVEQLRDTHGLHLTQDRRGYVQLVSASVKPKRIVEHVDAPEAA